MDQPIPASQQQWWKDCTARWKERRERNRRIQGAAHALLAAGESAESAMAELMLLIDENRSLLADRYPQGHVNEIMEKAYAAYKQVEDAVAHAKGSSFFLFENEPVSDNGDS